MRGVRGLRKKSGKKSEGPEEMVSVFQDEKRGFGLPLSADELAKVNFFRQQEGRSPLKETPGLRFLLHLKMPVQCTVQYTSRYDGSWWPRPNFIHLWREPPTK